MSKAAKKQKIVSELEDKYRDKPSIVTDQLIKDLETYVRCAGNKRVVSRPDIVVDAVKAMGFLPIQELSAETRSKSSHYNLYLCIIGNFLAGKGRPNRDKMMFFCNQYLRGG